MSHPLCQNAGVIIENLSLRKGDRLIARFGTAELLVDAFGRTELRGGSQEDIVEAREWVSLFFHEAAPTVTGVRRKSC